MTPTCERCKGPGEETSEREWFCPRCGVWLNVAGDEIGPPISPEQASKNYEAFVVDTAKEVVQAARMTPAARFELLHDLYAPMVPNEETGMMERDPRAGVISKEEFLRMLDAPMIPCPTPAPNGDPPTDKAPTTPPQGEPTK